MVVYVFQVNQVMSFQNLSATIFGVKSFAHRIDTLFNINIIKISAIVFYSLSSVLRTDITFGTELLKSQASLFNFIFNKLIKIFDETDSFPFFIVYLSTRLQIDNNSTNVSFKNALAQCDYIIYSALPKNGRFFPFFIVT